MNSFISVDKNGRVVIQNAVIFHSNEITLHIDKQFGNHGHGNFGVMNLRVFRRVPRWWQLIKWWQVIQLLRAACKEPTS